MSNFEELSIEELEQKLKTTQKIRLTVGVIFGLIVLIWVALGYWYSNLPVFISTIAMGLTTLAITSMAPQQIAKEIHRRRENAETPPIGNIDQR